MRVVLLLIFVLNIGKSSFCQWNSIREVSDNSSLVDLEVLNQDTVFVLGSVFEQGSFVLRSHDGGSSWDSTWFEGYDFTGIDFPSVLDGYISSFHNSRVSVLKTTDGGDNWFVSKDSLILAQSIPFDIDFYNVNIGVVSLPAWSAITTDGGYVWNEIENHPIGGQSDIIIRDDLYVGMSGALLTYSSDFCENFESVMLSYSGAHLSMDVQDDILFSTATGSGGIDLGFPDNSFAILTKSMFPFDSQSILYLPFISRFYDVSITPSDFSTVHGVVLANNGTLKFVKSSDGGTIWNYLSHEIFSYSNSSQLECANDSVCFAMSNVPGEIYKTTNGGGALGEEVNQVVLGVEEWGADFLDFELFPNPAISEFTISSLTADITLSEIALLDISGRIIRYYNLPKNPLQKIIPVSDLSTGMYLVRIRTKNNRYYSHKLIIK